MSDPQRPGNIPLESRELASIREEALDFAGIGLYRYSFDGTVIFMDRGAMRILDLEGLYSGPDELVGKNIESLLVYTGPKGWLRENLRKNKRVRDLEYRFRTLAGEERWALHDSFVTVDEKTGAEVIQAIIRDITARKNSEERLRYFALAVDSASDAIGMCTPDGRHYYQNRAFDEMFGEIGEDPPSAYVDCRDWQRVYEAMNAGKSWSGDVRMKGKDGREIDVFLRAFVMRDQDGKVVGMVGLHTDITERRSLEADRKKLENQMQEAQKLESLGLLAGGIAHDFNNLLTGILGNAGLALDELSPISLARGNIADIEIAARRAADLCRQLLAYSGKGRFTVQSIDIRELIREMGHMLEVSIHRKIALHFDLPAEMPSVEGDPTQIRQVVMNLIINASEAIGDDTGIISVVGGTMNCTRQYLKNYYFTENLSEGTYVFLEVTDNGCGMDEETKNKIFEPFYTTKFTGRGLGMAAVLGIVRGHRGAIKIYSEPGRGTTIKVILPASGRPADRVPDVVDGAVEWKGSGIVLLADDEEIVRNIGKRIIEGAGFSSVLVKDGVEAVRMFRRIEQELGETVTCVILDLTMPRMDGQEAFREIRLLRENVPIILSSGYNEQDVVQKFVGRGLAGFIQKPYQAADLVSMLRKVVGGE